MHKVKKCQGDAKCPSAMSDKVPKCLVMITKCLNVRMMAKCLR